jgi:OOP family OmpA-OmpF porin
MVLAAGVLSLSACAGYTGYSGFDKLDEVKALNKANAVGNAFTQQLAAEYRNYVNRELSSYNDHADALHFSRKGLSAARGDMVMPEPISDWNLNTGHAEELIIARSRLVNVMALGAREMQPDLAAFAQARFDCWIEEREENFQADKISGCQSQFMDALAQLESAMPMAPVQAPEPAPMMEPMVEAVPTFDVNPAEPMLVENAKYIVFFDFDASTLNSGANSILDSAANEAQGRDLISINLIGHTDTSGSRDYNQRLSMKRANAVRDGLVQRGVNPSLISVNHRGESELMVDTADGVREPANRRTEITFQ